MLPNIPILMGRMPWIRTAGVIDPGDVVLEVKANVVYYFCLAQMCYYLL
jgi:hypothetical protein